MARAVINALLALERQNCETSSLIRSPHSRESLDIKTPAEVRGPPLRIIGVGGAGLNILSRIPKTEFEDAEVFAADTDSVHLAVSGVPRKILLPASPGMLSGSDSNPACGREAALEVEEELRAALVGARYVIVLCGLGGGTGSGAAPVIARIARDAGLMTAAICVWPFSGEGRNMELNAEISVRRMMKTADIMVLVPNDALMEADPKLSLNMAFEAMDKIIIRSIKSIFQGFSSLERQHRD